MILGQQQATRSFRHSTNSKEGEGLINVTDLMKFDQFSGETINFFISLI